MQINTDDDSLCSSWVLSKECRSSFRAVNLPALLKLRRSSPNGYWLKQTYQRSYDSPLHFVTESKALRASWQKGFNIFILSIFNSFYMKRIFIAISFLIAALNSFTQEVKPLGIGDTLPDVTIHLLEPNGLKTVRLADYYNDKPLVLDFWASWCVACIKGMTKADSLLRNTNAAVNVLPITYEDEKTVRSFIDKRATMKALRLRFAVNDGLLMGKLFAFRTLPHAVWIGTDGVVKAITYAEEMNKENLQAFAAHHLPVLREKKDNLVYSPKDPLPVGDSNFIYRSVLTSYQPGLQSVMGTFTALYNSAADYQRFIGINKNAFALYYFYYSRGRGDVTQKNRVELHLRDSITFDPYLNKEATRSLIEPSLYCYELMLPNKVKSEEFFQWLLMDLNRCLPYKGTIEKRERLCWVVKSVDSTMHPKAAGGKKGIKWKEGIVQRFINQPMDIVCDYFNWSLEYPVVNESSVTYNLDMEVDIKEERGRRVNFLSAESVKESLERYGFTISLERRLVDILVIRDK